MNCITKNQTKIHLSKVGAHQDDLSVKCIPPYTRAYTPLLYRKTGVYRGIPIFLNLDPKYRLWVLVRTASPSVPTMYVLSKNKKNIKFFLMKFSIFATEKISIYCMGMFS